ncbi:MAG: RsmD family RNA methyltransferase [Chloroflexi bacterium]|nr:RsmD family RNA methyltransferase [Chloroflexota bacterium]
MRVIAGSVKGRRLKGPPERSRRGKASVTRPSSDLLRESLFSTLDAMGADFSRVLDLYAGSGALGIEALSRGGGTCDFVERQSAACRLIAENLGLTGFESEADVLCMPVEKALGKLGGPYTLVLADPPYADDATPAVMVSLAESHLVETGETVIALEHSAREEPRAALGSFSLVKSRRHGDSAVSIYR